MGAKEEKAEKVEDTDKKSRDPHLRAEEKPIGFAGLIGFFPLPLSLGRADHS